MAIILGHKYDKDEKLIPPDKYDIYHKPYGSTDKSEHKRVGEARTRNGANQAIDRRDNKYGSYAHYAVPVYDSKKPKDT